MGELGDMLYDARRAAAVSLADVAHATRIRASILNSLEKGDWDHLPAPGYVRGFVSDYARYLNLDPEPFIKQFEAETGHSRLGGHVVPPPVPTNHLNIRRSGSEVAWRPLALVLGIAVLVGVGVWLVLSLGSHGSITPPPVDPVGSADATGTPGTGSDSDDVELQPFTLKIIGVEGGASQMTIIIDGRSAYDGAITSGQEEEYSGVEKAEITAENPDAVQVLQNGTVIPGLVAGEVFTLTLPSTR